MSTLRSFAGLFASVSLFVLGAGCAGVGGEDVGSAEQSIVATPSCCPAVAPGVAPPSCVCAPEESIIGVEDPSDPPSDPPSEPGACPVGEHEECNAAPSHGNSIIGVPVCACVPDDDGCPDDFSLMTICNGVIQPAGSIWVGSNCVAECVPVK